MSTISFIITILLGIIGLVGGWMIYPYTVGGLEGWVQSPLQRLSARITMAFVGAIGVPFGLWMFISGTSEKPNESNPIVSESVTVRSQTRDPEEEFEDDDAEVKVRTVKESSSDPVVAGAPAQPEVRIPAPKAVDVPKPRESAAGEVSLADSIVSSSDGEIDQPAEKAASKPTSPERGRNTDQLQVRIAELKGELAAVETKIETERSRWQESVNVINRHTNFKRTPVRNGSPQYYQCVQASRIIKEVEAGAGKLKEDKARIEAMIRSLEEE